MLNKASLVTFVAVSLSIVSVFLIIRGDLYLSFIFALLAFFADCLDGYVARKFKEDSEFGRQLDSQSDTIIYLIYPVLVFNSYFKLSDPLSVIVQCIFVFTGIFRLSRFNDMGFVKSRFGKAYPGIPVVFSFINILILMVINKFLPSGFYFLSNALIAIHSGLMVTIIPFPKPKTSTIVLTVLFSLFIFIIYGKALI